MVQKINGSGVPLPFDRQEGTGRDGEPRLETQGRSVKPRPGRSVAVFGAGIAGMSVAHELIRLGYQVRVYEANPQAGGFFRSARLPGEGNLPTEYSWHGMGPWYHNTFDILQQIPFDESGSLYDRALSRPIEFGIFPEKGRASFYDRGLRSIPSMFAMSGLDFIRWSWVMLKTWSANRRTEEHYSRLSAAEQWRAVLSERCSRNWRSCFGPWVGSDWTICSLHTAGQFFRKQLLCRPSHRHRADAEGPAWNHGAGDGWLLLRGPSSEYWFDKWVEYLSHTGVEFAWNEALLKLRFDGTTITGADLRSGMSVQADLYVVAIDPFAAAEIFARTPTLESQPEVCRFRPLTQDGPHTQVSFRLAFSEPVRFPRKRTAVVLADTEFNLTLFAEEQVWERGVDLGEGVKSLWTGTSCVGTAPGRIHMLPVVHCTREQFLEEVQAQVLACESLDALVREANGGRGLRELPLLRVEVWHEWVFGGEGLRSQHQKWVTTTNTQPHLPSQSTPIPNLFLAGAHTRTEADVWSIEGAVESGRRAARGIDPRVPVRGQYKPSWLRWLSRLDDACFRVGAPHILDLLLIAFVLAVVALAVW